MRWLLLFFALAACQQDETVSGYLGESDGLFQLVSLNDQAFDGDATIDLSEAGRVSGKAPCNTYFAEQTAPYPWFEIGPIASTKRACPDLDVEQLFFKVMGRMTLAEVSGSTLILSNTDDESLVFQAP